MSYERDDPYWITAGFQSKCACGATIRKGDRVYYYPKGRTAVCEGCGNLGAADLADARMHENPSYEDTDPFSEYGW